MGFPLGLSIGTMANAVLEDGTGLKLGLVLDISKVCSCSTFGSEKLNLKYDALLFKLRVLFRIKTARVSEDENS